jgi:hypothetical protein
MYTKVNKIIDNQNIVSEIYMKENENEFIKLNNN